MAALAAVAHERSFRRAADRLGYVQSAISSQIAHLERAAGTRLVERSSGPATIRLTAAGRILLIHTDVIIARLEAAYVDVNSLASRISGTVRIAGLERFAPRRLARIVRCFRERNRLATIRLVDAGSDQLNFELLEAGMLDLAVGELPLPEGAFAHVVLEQDPYVLLVPAGCSLATASAPPSVCELSSLRLMIPAGSGGSSPGVHAQLLEMGIEPRSSFEPDSIATAQALVGAGLDHAIVPRSLLDPDDPKTIAVEVPGLPERTTVLGFLADHEQPSAVYTFIRAVSVACEAERAAATGLQAPRFARSTNP